MLKLLFMYSCILISMGFIANVFFGKQIHCNKESKKLKLHIGLASALNSIILLFFPIAFNDINFSIALIPIITSAFYGGQYSVIVSSLVLLSISSLFPSLCILSIPQYISLFLICLLYKPMIKALKQSYKLWISILIMFCIIQNIYSAIEYKSFYNVVEHISYFDIINILAAMLAYFIFVYMGRYNTRICQLEKDCVKDYLTDTYNVRAFENEISKLSQNKLTKDISLLILDIDHFKLINDIYGHITGDIVLKDFANILKKNCREFDNICRIGGEEFAIILRKCTKEHARLVSKRIKEEVANHQFFTDKNEPIHITVSIGVAQYPETSILDLKKRADIMLYKAKNSGRNRICS